MQINKIPKDVLETFYRETHGVIGLYPVPKTAYATDDFDVYCALRSILYPEALPGDHANSDSRFRHLAGNLPESPEPEEPLLWHDVSRKKEMDLATAGIPAGVTSLLVDACKSLRGWPFLKHLGQMDTLTASMCTGMSEADLDAPLSLKSLSIDECGPNTTNWLLRNVAAASLDLTWYATPVFDCSRIIHAKNLERLSLTASLIRSPGHLIDAQPAYIQLHHVAPDENLFSFLKAQKRLLHLDLATTRPLSPQALEGVIEKLDILTLPAWPDEKTAWIKWAVNHPRVRCRFQHPEVTELPSKVARAEVAAVHRDYAILKLTKGRSVKFEVADDFSGLYPDHSNGDIEAALEPLAKAAKKKIDWSSEADMLVAGSKKEEDLIWLLDTLLDERPAIG